jgi:hypothetical protein
MTASKFSSLAVFALSIGACKLVDPPSGVPDDTATEPLIPSGPGLESTSFGASSNSSGRVRVEIEVPPGVVSFQLTAQSEYYARVEEVIDPEGETVVDAADWIGADQSLTQAFFIVRPTMAFDWPVRPSDGPLVPGTWVVWLGHSDQFNRAVENEPLDLSVALKRDPDLEVATIGVQIVYADGVEDEAGVVEAVEGAVERWRKVWDSEGIELVEHYETSKLDPSTSFLFDGDNMVANVAGRKSPGDLQLIVGERVAGDPLILGISAAIPGTVEPSPHTFVVLSWLSHAGPDGEFTQDEIGTMGETMAHEVGHYIGLFHPVEVTFADWDALDDTEECGSPSSCESAMGRNVMFPYPLCTFAECQAQGQLTGDQAAVVHQQVSAL